MEREVTGSNQPRPRPSKPRRLEKRILELLEAHDWEFDELCFELQQSPGVVNRAVQELCRRGWISLVPWAKYVVYHAKRGALVGWTREQET